MEKEDKHKVLVTGGAGFIGSHVCKALHDANFEPITIDNLSTGYEKFVKWGKLHKGDLQDRTFLERVFDKEKISSVIHLAAKASVQDSLDNPIDYYRGNIETTTNLVDVMLSFGVTRIIFSSSCSVYGEQPKVPVDETTNLNPISPYAFTKLASEKLIQSLKPHGLQYAILRYFNVSGCDYLSGIGENHKPEQHLIPLCIKSARQNKEINIYGNDFHTIDGTAVRDYIHVVDLADAHVKALKLLLNESESYIVNLGSGIPTSILEIMEEITRRYENTKYIFRPRREGDPSAAYSNISYAKKLLNWEPRRSSIANIIDDLENWYGDLNVI